MKASAAPLKLGIPKGSLEQSTIELFAKAGWRISTSGRSFGVACGGSCSELGETAAFEVPEH